MKTTLSEFLHCFVPLFVAVDAIGCLPLFIGLTHGLGEPRRRAVVAQSVVTAMAVALVFLAAGPALLGFLGVSVPDFMIAGGVLLLALSLADMIAGAKRQRQMDPLTMGAVPIGIPLITGPAVLTTSLVLVHDFGLIPSAVAIVANVAIAGVVFRFAGPISRFLGNAGTKTVSKIASLLLAAIAVMFIRKGLAAILGS